jgi:uncharacterized protein
VASKKPPLPESIELELGLDEPDDDAALRARVADALRVSPADVPHARIVRRAVDARRKVVRFHVTVELAPPPAPESLGGARPRDVRRPARVVVVGDGPCGLFCAYELARHGIASIVVDRGKTVQPRRVDLKGLNRHGTVDVDSNYCFGEGGAGTYSDGKLYTRATKRGDVRDVMEVLALHGAPVDILVEARPHIGSNLLPKVVTSIRERLEAVGVEFRFGARVVGLLTKDGRVAGVRLHGGEELAADAVVMATGHSARDVYDFLQAAGVRLEAKAFALGVRIEHPQPLVDRIQYGVAAGHPKLRAASYKLVEQVDGRGVFSFCMCPGGFIVPAATEPTGVVVNGMSLKRRDSPYANSGLVVAIEPADASAAGFTGPFACLDVQRKIEEAARAAGGGGLRAPATRSTDFVARRGSTTAPPTSYQPGLTPGDLTSVLDAAVPGVADRLRQALVAFDRRMKGYLTEDAVLVGVESRTSAPVRVPRDRATLQSPDVVGLYPAGEGAGYAGGIVSAALDGVHVARAIRAALVDA